MADLLLHPPSLSLPVAGSPRGGRRRVRPLALAVTTALTLGALTGVAAPPAAAAAPFSIAVLGDTPYGTTQEASFPKLVASVDADPAVSMVLHAGDIKSSTTSCSDARLQATANQFATFDDPLVLTPGDNEWTDCHEKAAGRFVPTERLDAVRRIFFPVAGQTIGGAPMAVTPQSAEQPAHAPYRENVRFVRDGVVFGTVHIVGSRNDQRSWSGLAGGDQPTVRKAEYAARQAANLAWIDATFDAAVGSGAPAVVLMTHAEPLATTPYLKERTRILDRARAFGKPVLLVHGDEHRYEVEPNYGGVGNLTRLETYGNTTSNWLRLTVDTSKAQPFSWEPRTVS